MANCLLFFCEREGVFCMFRDAWNCFQKRYRGPSSELYCYIEGQIGFLSLWLQLQKRSLHTVYQCGNVTLDFHYAPSDFTGKACSIGTLSMESSSVSDTVLNFCLEPTNVNSVFVVFKVILEEKGHLPNFPILQRNRRACTSQFVLVYVKRLWEKFSHPILNVRLPNALRANA